MAILSWKDTRLGWGGALLGFDIPLTQARAPEDRSMSARIHLLLAPLMLLVLTTTSVAGADTPTASDITVGLDRVIYADGGQLHARVTFARGGPPKDSAIVLVVAPETRDVEYLLLPPDGHRPGEYRSTQPLTVQAGTSGTPWDGKLIAHPGEAISALYYLENAKTPDSKPSVQVIADVALMADPRPQGADITVNSKLSKNAL